MPSHFDPDMDAQALQKAMKGLGKSWEIQVF